jgi:hypothetical protein
MPSESIYIYGKSLERTIWLGKPISPLFLLLNNSLLALFLVPNLTIPILAFG